MSELQVIRKNEMYLAPEMNEYVEIAKAVADESAFISYHMPGPKIIIQPATLAGRRLFYLYFMTEVEGRELYRVWSVTKIDFTLLKAVTYVHHTQQYEDLQDMAELFKKESEKNKISHAVLPLLDFETTILRGNVALVKKDTFEFCDRKGKALTGAIAF